jgi:uncharacterized protein (TIGR02646 family)
MRHIKKTAHNLRHLDNAHTNPPRTSQEATSRWKSFRKHKQEVLDALTREQHHLCAYPEVRPDQFGIGAYIEHIEPKSQTPARTFDYYNLIISALHSDDLEHSSPTTQGDVFAGHAKQENYDPVLFISPLDPRCEESFLYLKTGEVVPNPQLPPDQIARAQYTIEVLNLNCGYLQALRRSWADEIDQMIDEHFDKRWSVEALAQIHLIPIRHKLYPFFSMTRHIFGPLAERILDAPNELSF